MTTKNTKSTTNQMDDEANDDGFTTVGKGPKSTSKTPAKSTNYKTNTATITPGTEKAKSANRYASLASFGFEMNGRKEADTEEEQKKEEGGEEAPAKLAKAAPEGTHPKGRTGAGGSGGYGKTTTQGEEGSDDEFEWEDDEEETRGGKKKEGDDDDGQSNGWEGDEDLFGDLDNERDRAKEDTETESSVGSGAKPKAKSKAKGRRKKKPMRKRGGSTRRRTGTGKGSESMPDEYYSEEEKTPDPAKVKAMQKKKEELRIKEEVIIFSLEGTTAGTKDELKLRMQQRHVQAQKAKIAAWEKESGISLKVKPLDGGAIMDTTSEEEGEDDDGSEDDSDDEDHGKGEEESTSEDKDRGGTRKMSEREEGEPMEMDEKTTGEDTKRKRDEAKAGDAQGEGMDISDDEKSTATPLQGNWTQSPERKRRSGVKATKEQATEASGGRKTTDEEDASTSTAGTAWSLGEKTLASKLLAQSGSTGARKHWLGAKVSADPNDGRGESWIRIDVRTTLLPTDLPKQPKAKAELLEEVVGETMDAIAQSIYHGEKLVLMRWDPQRTKEERAPDIVLGDTPSEKISEIGTPSFTHYFNKYAKNPKRGNLGRSSVIQMRIRMKGATKAELISHINEQVEDYRQGPGAKVTAIQHSAEVEKKAWIYGGNWLTDCNKQVKAASRATSEILRQQGILSDTDCEIEVAAEVGTLQYAPRGSGEYGVQGEVLVIKRGKWKEYGPTFVAQASLFGLHIIPMLTSAKVGQSKHEIREAIGRMKGNKLRTSILDSVHNPFSAIRMKGGEKVSPWTVMNAWKYGKKGEEKKTMLGILRDKEGNWVALYHINAEEEADQRMMALYAEMRQMIPKEKMDRLNRTFLETEVERNEDTSFNPATNRLNRAGTIAGATLTAIDDGHHYESEVSDISEDEREGDEKQTKKKKKKKNRPTPRETDQDEGTEKPTEKGTSPTIENLEALENRNPTWFSGQGGGGGSDGMSSLLTTGTASTTRSKLAEAEAKTRLAEEANAKQAKELEQLRTMLERQRVREEEGGSNTQDRGKETDGGDDANNTASGPDLEQSHGSRPSGEDAILRGNSNTDSLDGAGTGNGAGPSA